MVFVANSIAELLIVHQFADLPQELRIVPLASANGAIDDAKEEAERQIRRERKVHIRMWRKSGAAFKRLMRME